jgi:hypothetical protein
MLLFPIEERNIKLVQLHARSAEVPSLGLPRSCLPMFLGTQCDGFPFQTRPANTLSLRWATYINHRFGQYRKRSVVSLSNALYVYREPCLRISITYIYIQRYIPEICDVACLRVCLYHIDIHRLVFTHKLWFCASLDIWAQYTTEFSAYIN